MTDMRDVSCDDDFDAFLQREGKLSQLLQSLPQPEPSAELDAAILTRAQAELANDMAPSRLAANDPAIPDAAGQRQPSFLRRRAAPLALAASVLCAFLLMLRWQAQPESAMPIIVAQAPQASVSAPAGSTGDASAAPPAAMSPAPQASSSIRKSDTVGAAPAAKSASPQNTVLDTPLNEPQVASVPEAARKEAEPPTRLAQADVTDAPPASVPTPAAAAPSLTTSNTASGDAAANSASLQKAKAWVALIEELLKADLRQDALAEWEKFRQAYPRYPVPEKLEAQIKALKK